MQDDVVSVSWFMSPIREQLSQFSRERKRAVFLDRRVDPTVAIKIQLSNRTTDQVIWALASENGLGVATIGDLLYVGPKRTAARLPWVIADAKKQTADLPKSQRKKWSTESSIQWPEATTTEDITAWFQSQGIMFEEAVPLDVWPAADWPKLTLLQQTFLFLAGFDKEPQIKADGKTVTLADLRPIKSKSLKLRIDQNPNIDLQAAAERIPGLKARKTRRTISVTGDVVSLMEFQRLVAVGKQVKVPDGGTTLSTLQITGVQRRAVLQSIAAKMNYQIQFEAESEQAMKDMVSVDVERATFDELLVACLDGSGCSYRMDGQRIRIFRK